jgi:hypothetical protein
LKISPFIVACFSLSLFSSGAHGADADHGKELHDPSCITGCHSSKVDGASNDLYKRQGRRDSLEKLTAQVNFCNQQVLDSEWWPEDELDVVEYLNSQFYHFK